MGKSRRNKKKNKKAKFRAVIQGTKFFGKGRIKTLPGPYFAYRGLVYDVRVFSERDEVNLDKSDEDSVEDYDKKKWKNTGVRISHENNERQVVLYSGATLQSNIGECPDVQKTTEEK